MTPEEKIDKIYDVVIGMEPMVRDHHKDLYGDGNGQKGIKSKLVLLEERQENCPAKKAVSSENKQLNIATVMMVIAIIGIIASTALGVLNYLKN